MKGLEEKCQDLVTFRRCLVPSITPQEADTAYALTYRQIYF